MRDRVLLRRMVLFLALTGAVPLRGVVVPMEEGAEFRFAGAPARTWRSVWNRVDRMGWKPASQLRAVSASGRREVWWSDRLVVRTLDRRPLPPAKLEALGLRPVRSAGDGLLILQARDAWEAARSADLLRATEGVDVSTPVLRRTMALHGPFVPRPNDPYFTNQWHLEDRDAAGHFLGPDLNPRAAWAVTRGAGITVAVCDDGFETDHPDLLGAADGGPHFDFTKNRTNVAVYGSHATCVAGLIGATGGNGIGVSGVAPEARLASWEIFDAFGEIVSDERLMDMFQYRMEDVPVQNHSWGNADITLLGPSALEEAAISRAIEQGRDGRGTIFVRSAGNGRESDSNVNDDGYANDPRVIAVAAVRQDGRVASYSNPGACILVGTPSGDDEDTFAPTINICTTDRVGRRGYNQAGLAGDLVDYAFLSFGFSGTSASAPQVSGIVALMLAANPTLTYRDAQQVLAHAARHRDPADPDVRTNAAGYVVSHNQGFGVPDAGQAVRLARDWVLRPPLVTATVTNVESVEVPDDGLRLWVSEAAGAGERGISCRPALGPHPDVATSRLPLVFVGTAQDELTQDLRGAAALIERGTNYFREKIANAAKAGATFAVIYNNVNGDETLVPAGTDFVPIPAVLIGENEGRALVSRIQNGERVMAQVRMESVPQEFVMKDALVCEHVGLRLRSNHEHRGDLRITLVSPGGTRSVLQRLNPDDEPGPEDWTYWSVQHFYESAIGTWRAWYSDEKSSGTGEILEATLMIRGVAIKDTDADGLDDRWEQRWFGGLGAGPRDDPDLDGSPNAREQVLGTDPNRPDAELRIDAAAYDSRIVRLSWPANGAHDYRVFGRDILGGEERLESIVAGQSPELEWVTPPGSEPSRYFRLEAVAHASKP